MKNTEFTNQPEQPKTSPILLSLSLSQILPQIFRIQTSNESWKTKMKILLTGFNPSQTTRNYHLHSSKLHIVPWHYSLYNCLVDMGHEVEQRSIPLGEPVRPLSSPSTYSELDISYSSNDQYDEVILFLGSPTQRVSSKFYEGLWTISQFPNCILAFDDWQVKKQWRGIVSLAAGAEGGDKLFGRFVLERVNKKTLEQVKPYEKELKKGLAVILKKRNRVIVPGFQVRHLFDRSALSSLSSAAVVLGEKRSEEDVRKEFGAHLLFGEEIGYPRSRIFVVNPNPYHRNRTWEDPGHEGEESLEWRRRRGRHFRDDDDTEKRPKKRRRLNFASLAHSKTKTWLKKQCGVSKSKKAARAATASEDFLLASNQHSVPTTNGDKIPSHIGTWPLDFYGDRLEPERRLPEDEMIKVFAQDWACMMPKYEHAGSGWWRARPLQCADAGSVLVADDKELAVLYGWQYPFFGRTASDIVKLSQSELEDMASIQEWLLYAMHPLDKRVQRAEVSAVLHAPK